MYPSLLLEENLGIRKNLTGAGKIEPFTVKVVIHVIKLSFGKS